MKKIYIVFLLLLTIFTLSGCNSNNSSSKKYSVTLRGNGGTSISRTITVEYGKPMPAVSKPTRYGYTFLGYFDSMYQVSGKKYYNSNMSSARNWDKKSDTVLYAIWKYN